MSTLYRVFVAVVLALTGSGAAYVLFVAVYSVDPNTSRWTTVLYNALASFALAFFLEFVLRRWRDAPMERWTMICAFLLGSTSQAVLEANDRTLGEASTSGPTLLHLAAMAAAALGAGALGFDAGRRCFGSVPVSTAQRA
jgi:fluoride ion exporter CrcB/FEX